MSSRLSAKTRAITYLQRMRDATRDVFRNLQQNSKINKEEEWKERSDMLTSSRDKLLAVLHLTQTELGECVAELKSHSAHKARMDALHKEISRREVALHDYGDGLCKVEELLRQGLAQDGVVVPRRQLVSVDVDDLMGYAHMISYTSGAREGWEPNNPLVNSMPPAPNVSAIAQSRLFPARRPSKRIAKEGSGIGGSELTHSYEQMWKYPITPTCGTSAEVLTRLEESAAPHPAKRKAMTTFGVAHASQCTVVEQKVPPGKQLGDGHLPVSDLSLHRPAIVIPPRPAKWRPGDAITVMGSQEMPRPPLATAAEVGRGHG